MGRPKKEKFEYIPSRNLYRHREKGINNGRPVTARTPELLAIKLERLRDEARLNIDLTQNPTVQEYAERWLELRKPTIRHNTYKLYSGIIHQHIIPTIGHIYMRKVTPDDLLLLYASIADRSETSVKVIRTVTSMIFNAAVDNDIIIKTPVKRFKSLGSKPKEQRALSDQELQTIREIVRGTQFEPIFMIGLYTGMRIGEITALTWSHVKKNHIEVRQQIVATPSGQAVSTILKTNLSNRDIPLPEKLKEYLDTLPRDCEYVVHTRNKKPIYNASHLTENIKKVIPDFHTHSLRRTYLTRLIYAGIDPKTVQRIAGHATIKVTMEIYARAHMDRPDVLLERINNAMDKDDF